MIDKEEKESEKKTKKSLPGLNHPYSILTNIVAQVDPEQKVENAEKLYKYYDFIVIGKQSLYLLYTTVPTMIYKFI